LENFLGRQLFSFLDSARCDLFHDLPIDLIGKQRIDGTLNWR
jgi:hypothetical protein